MNNQKERWTENRGFCVKSCPFFERTKKNASTDKSNSSNRIEQKLWISFLILIDLSVIINANDYKHAQNNV